MNKAILSTLNYRILIVIVETILVFILYKQYEIYIEVDFFIFSIAIVFPLVFSITSAYQRRQEAIMIFSEFRNKIIDTSNILYAVNGIHKKDYDKMLGINFLFFLLLFVTSDTILARGTNLNGLYYLFHFHF